MQARAGVLAAALLLGSCAVGPDFVHPAPPDVARYTREPLATGTSSTDAPTGQSQHFTPGRDVSREWWRLFKSRTLDALIERSLNNNPNLQSAIATLRAANQAVYAQAGKFFPLVEANANPTYNRTSAALTPIPSSGATIYALHTAQLQVSYTLDIWGLNRRTVESLQAQADMQRFQVEAAYLTLVSNIAVAAINEASLRAQIEATNQIIATNTKLLDVLRRQLDTGYANRNEVALQEAALAQAAATLPPLRKALQQNRDLLSALAGDYPSEGPRETFKLTDLQLPTNLPLSLPSQLIEQRPDIRAAQEQLHAASAQIGVATANMLPNFTISGNVGYMNTALAGLLAPQNLFWTVAANATQTVVDGGALFHDLQEAKDNYNATAWSYRGVVIGAVQNVTDALRALQNDADALKAAHNYQRAAKISFDLAHQQMETGNANVLILLTAQQSYLQSVLQVTQARAARLSDTVALYQALGGGWWNRVQPLPERYLNVGTGEVTPVSDKDKDEGFLRGLWPFN
ncbi:MAG: efflux transporter outer membrane subunit [Hyphomicrobiales bacterium]|nr:efflux transporter outer membrane subunit [Hyphomicrobiales bacterium]